MGICCGKIGFSRVSDADSETAVATAPIIGFAMVKCKRGIGERHLDELRDEIESFAFTYTFMQTIDDCVYMNLSEVILAQSFNPTELERYCILQCRLDPNTDFGKAVKTDYYHLQQLYRLPEINIDYMRSHPVPDQVRAKPGRVPSEHNLLIDMTLKNTLRDRFYSFDRVRAIKSFQMRSGRICGELVLFDGTRIHVQDGRVHNMDGPAIITPDKRVRFYVNDQEIDQSFIDMYYRNLVLV